MSTIEICMQCKNCHYLAVMFIGLWMAFNSTSFRDDEPAVLCDVSWSSLTAEILVIVSKKVEESKLPIIAAASLAYTDSRVENSKSAYIYVYNSEEQHYHT